MRTITYALYVHDVVIVAFRCPVNGNAVHVMKSSICIYSCCTVYVDEQLPALPGFMQDQVIASRTCFGGHMDVNC